jgi:colanic acid/amylovoran biosynthesis glycosyltransferase
VHAHFIDKPAILALQTGRLLDVPVTVTAHARDYLCHVSSKVLAQRVAAAATTFTISDRAAVEIKALVRGHGVVSPNLRLVRATASFNPGIASVPDRPYAISIARLVEKKGIDVAIDAFSAVSEALPDLHYVIVGDGPERPRLEMLAVKRNVADKVHFFGWRPSSVAQRLLEGAVALLLPCRRSSDGDADGIPVVLMEAGLARTPVITTDIGGIAELVEADLGGLIVKPDDVTEISAALRSIVEEPLQARTYAEALHQRMTEEFNEGLQRDRLVSAWGEVIRR